MASNTIIVLDSYFNLTNNLISVTGFKAFNTIYTIFYNLEVAYFFGPPCTNFNIHVWHVWLIYCL